MTLKKENIGHHIEDWPLRPRFVASEEGQERDDYIELTLKTERGEIEARFTSPERPVAGVILVGGVGGGFDSPAKGLYEKLAPDLRDRGIATLRIRYRNPRILEEAAHDVLAGIRFLRDCGIRKAGLVGHSFGGAVIVMAASLADEACTLILLATQSYGTGAIGEMEDRSVLLVHGAEDEVLPVSCSVWVYEKAKGRKEIHVIEGAGHVLDEVAGEVERRVCEWLQDELLPNSKPLPRRDEP